MARSFPASLLFSGALAVVALALTGCSSDPAANDGAVCHVDTDCTSAICIRGVCASVGMRATVCVSASPEKTNLALCDGEPCQDAATCASGKCEAAKCGVTDGKTCGEGLAVKCANDEICFQDSDCASDVCSGAGRCIQPPPDVHADGRRNAFETGVDCGGVVSGDKPCEGGERCANGTDCQGLCNGMFCEPPTELDGKKNQGESDVDCGGPNAPKCLRGKECNANADCQLDACLGGHCVLPAASDNQRDGSETDVDCGGAGVTEGDFSYRAPRCREGKKCDLDADCSPGAGCSAAKICTIASCATGEKAGIETCGAGETGQGGEVHESCCKSLPLPTRGKSLDKYEITAGRFRTFLSKVGPDVRSWVSSFSGSHPGSQLARLVSMNGQILNLYPQFDTGPLSVVAHMSFDIDNYNGIRGCYNGDGSFGANTYYLGPEKLKEYGIPARVTPRSESDQKSLNCAMPIMFAAFCAWDGGEMPVLADYADAWPTTYPWGPTDIGRPNYNWCNGPPGTGGFACQSPALGNNGAFYVWPKNVDSSRDSEIFIAAPGRFTRDATALKANGESWFDLYGNLAEYSGDFVASANDFCDFSGAPAPGVTTCTRQQRPGGVGTRYTSIPVTALVGRTWEGHNYEKGTPNVWPVTGQYGKFGARCVRPTAR